MIGNITNIKPVSLSFHKGTVRDYIILANSNHSEQLLKAKYEMLHSKWGYKKICQDDESIKLWWVETRQIESIYFALDKREMFIFRIKGFYKIYKKWKQLKVY